MKKTIRNKYNEQAMRTRLVALRGDRSRDEMCDDLNEFLDNRVMTALNLSRYENGDRKIPSDVLAAYSECCHCPMDFIYFGFPEGNSERELRKELHELAEKYPKFD